MTVTAITGAPLCLLLYRIERRYLIFIGQLEFQFQGAAVFEGQSVDIASQPRLFLPFEQIDGFRRTVVLHGFLEFPDLVGQSAQDSPCSICGFLDIRALF